MNKKLGFETILNNYTAIGFHVCENSDCDSDCDCYDCDYNCEECDNCECNE